MCEGMGRVDMGWKKSRRKHGRCKSASGENMKMKSEGQRGQEGRGGEEGEGVKKMPSRPPFYDILLPQVWSAALI